MSKRYEYRVTALREDDSPYYLQYHYNKTVAAHEVAFCKRCPDVKRVIYERREMGSSTFALVSTWQRKPEPDTTPEAHALNKEILPMLETPAAIALVSQAIEESQPGILRTEIAYGPEYNQQLEAFAGVPLRSLRNCANCVYVKPTYSAYEYPDGRVLVVLNKIMTDMLYLLPDHAAFRRFEDDHFAYDPEDTRVRYNGRHAGRIER